MSLGKKKILSQGASGIVPTDHFEPVIYTGNGSSQSISTLDFAPDFTWIKSRSDAYGHILNDSVRGANRFLYSNTTEAEDVRTNSDFSSFNSDGFTLGTNYVALNGLNKTYVAWNWKAGGAAVSNTDGTITSQVSANVDAGFSVVKFTSPSSGVATIGTGLNKKAELIISKVTNTTADWPVFVDGFDTTDYILLNTTAAKVNHSSDLWNLSNWSDTTFGCHRDMFGTSNTVITYTFHSVDGYQKVGSYTGTTAAKQVDVGFQPRFVMIKNSSRAGEHWFIADYARTGDPSPVLKPNISNAEQINSSTDIDFYTSGFSLDNAATASAGLNENGDTYIYLAIA